MVQRCVFCSAAVMSAGGGRDQRRVESAPHPWSQRRVVWIPGGAGRCWPPCGSGSSAEGDSARSSLPFSTAADETSLTYIVSSETSGSG